MDKTLPKDFYELLQLRERDTNYPATFTAYCDNYAANVGDLAVIFSTHCDVTGVACNVPAEAIEIMRDTDDIPYVEQIFGIKWSRVVKEDDDNA